MFFPKMGSCLLKGAGKYLGNGAIIGKTGKDAAFGVGVKHNKEFGRKAQFGVFAYLPPSCGVQESPCK